MTKNGDITGTLLGLIEKHWLETASRQALFSIKFLLARTLGFLGYLPNCGFDRHACTSSGRGQQEVAGDKYFNAVCKKFATRKDAKTKLFMAKLFCVSESAFADLLTTEWKSDGEQQRIRPAPELHNLARRLEKAVTWTECPCENTERTEERWPTSVRANVLA